MTPSVHDGDMLLCQMREVVWPIDDRSGAGSSRGWQDWGARATQWLCGQMSHVKNTDQGLTVVGCKILTEIVEHHLKSPSATFEDFFTNTLLPIVIETCHNIVDNDTHCGLMVAILKLLKQNLERTRCSPP